MATIPFDELCTSRLRMRRLQREDLAVLCAYRSIPEVARFQSWDSFTLEDGVRLIAEQSGHEPDVSGTWFQLAITHGDSGDMIGDCGLQCPLDNPRQMEIGITLAPAHQGRGFATEALVAILDYAFACLQKHRVMATTDADNTAAAALLNRVGFRREGHFIESVWFKEKWGSEFCFALLRREWEQHRTKDKTWPLRRNP